MKTTSSPSAPTSNKAGLTVEPYIVAQQWVKVEATDPGSIARVLAERRPFVRSKYGRTVAAYIAAASGTIRTAEMDCLELNVRAPIFDRIWRKAVIYQSIRGTKAAKITLRFEAYQWAGLVKVAETIQLPPVAIVRAALAERVESLRRFDAHQQER